MTTFLGFTENILGAWQLVRKAGRMHTKQKFLEENQNQDTKNYFNIVAQTFILRLIPYLSGEKEQPVKNGENEKKKVRFASNYSQTQITELWTKFFDVLVDQLSDSFDQEVQKQTTVASQQALAPHQHVEEAVRRKKKIQERIEHEAEMPDGDDDRKVEELFEDPF